MLATRRQRFKMISVREACTLLVALFVIIVLVPSSSAFGFDSANSCSPNGGGPSKQSRRGRAQMMATIPCDLTQQVYCHLPGSAYPWHAVRRFVHENQGLMKRMYGDVKHISVLRDEILGNEIDVEDVAMAAERYSRNGIRRSAKVMRRGGGDEEYMGAGRPTNVDVLKEPHFRPMTTTSSTTTKTTTTTEASSSRPTPPTTTITIGETAKPEVPTNGPVAVQEVVKDDDEEIEDLAVNSVYELIPPALKDGPSELTGDNIQIIASPQFGGVGVANLTATPTTTLKTDVATTTTTEFVSSTTTTTTPKVESTTTTTTTLKTSSTTTPRTTTTTTASSSSASPFRRRQRPSMLYKQHYQQPSQQQSQMLHLKISSTIMRDPSTGVRTKFNESERIAVKGVGGLPAPPTATTTTTTTNRRKPIKNETLSTSTTTLTSGGSLKGDRFRKPTATTQNANSAAQSTTTTTTPSGVAASTAAAIAAAVATKPVLRDGQLYQDTLKQEPAPPAIPVTNMRGVNACPVKEEVVAPFWANNTRGEVLALLNLYPFEQYVHWEKCTHEHKQMYCRDGCRCEQQYRLHRLLAYDPHNECRGIFSDWFRFPSCCICKCYNVPMEFRATSRSPRADQSGLNEHDVDAAPSRQGRHPIENAEAEVKRAIYEHATEEWYRPVRDELNEDDVDDSWLGGDDEFGELF